jgi:hypothetical protein
LPALSLGVLLMAACVARDPSTETDAASATETTTSSAAETTTSGAAETTTSGAAETTTSGAAETTVDADSTTGPAFCEPLPASTDDCCCFATVETDDGVTIVNGYPTPMLCNALEIQCPVEDPDCPVTKDLSGGEFVIDDEEALTCILTALRDGTEGTLQWHYTGASQPGYAYYDQTVHILPDRRTFTSVLAVVDLGGEWSDVTEQALAAPDGFDACLQAADVRERAACLLEPTDGEVLAVCTEGGYFSEF